MTATPKLQKLWALCPEFELRLVVCLFVEARPVALNVVIAKALVQLTAISAFLLLFLYIHFYNRARDV
jgi:hypothetical protein